LVFKNLSFLILARKITNRIDRKRFPGYLLFNKITVIPNYTV
jgi:hypothetical protein